MYKSNLLFSLKDNLFPRFRMSTLANPHSVPKPPKGGVNVFLPNGTSPAHLASNLKKPAVPLPPPKPPAKPPPILEPSFEQPPRSPLPDVVKNSLNLQPPPSTTPKHGAKGNYVSTVVSSGEGRSPYIDSFDSDLLEAAKPNKKDEPKLINVPSVEDRRFSLKKVVVNDFSPPEPNFGNNLMHKQGMEVVGKMIDEELSYFKSWRKYLEERLKIEQSYSKALSDIHEKQSIQSPLMAPEIYRETFTTFPSFMTTSQTYLESLSQGVNILSKDTLPAIRSLIASKKSVKELYTSQLNKLEKEKHSYTRKMEDSRRLYGELYKEVDNQRTNCINAASRNAKNSDKLKKAFLAKCHDLVESHNNYIMALKACDIFEQWYTESLLPVFLNTYQRIFMLQTDFYSSFYDNFVTTMHARLDPSGTVIQQLMNTGSTLNGDREYEQVIAQRGGPGMKRTPLEYDERLPKHKFIELLPEQLSIQNRDVTGRVRNDLSHQLAIFQQNTKSKHTELTYMDKAIRNTQGGHKPLSGYPFDINELCRSFATIMLEMQTECYRQEICQLQLKMVEAALGATDGVDVDDSDILDSAFHERMKGSKTLDPAAVAPPKSGQSGLVRRYSLTEVREKASSTKRPATPPDVHSPRTGSGEVVPIEEEPWYFGEISRDEAEKLLIYDGDYLVRYSSGQRGFVISTRCRGAIKHFVVKKENGMYMFNKQGFMSVRSLLEHQQLEKQPLVGEFYLLRAITRNEGDKWEITEKDLELMDKIGKGNFGYVYKGYMNSRSQLVAIKMCKSDALTDQDEFLREADILKQYRHPNIVEFIGVSQQAESIYIIMELMCGGDFLTFLRNKGLRERKHQLSSMVRDVSEGMSYLSSKDCVHRDLAARNCLIGENKSVKISDFGMSRQLSEGEYQMSTTNKPLPIKWTAPEALHKGLYTCQSDVWSYGILLWETFSCGSTPYPGMDSKTAIEKIESGFRLPAPSGTPQHIYTLMRNCWEYDPQDRPRFQEIAPQLANITQDLRGRNV